MDQKLRILHLEDDLLDAGLIKEVLVGQGLPCEILHVRSAEQFESALQGQVFDVVISDFALPGYDGFTALRTVTAQHNDIPFIIVSGTLGEEQAIDSLKSGATDYVLKQRLSRLAPAIRRAVAEARERRSRARAERQTREQAALLDKARDAICVTDMDQKILYWNRSAERLYGWSAAEAMGRNANELLFQEDLRAPLAALKTLIRKGEWQGELEQVTRDKGRLMVESRWTLMRDAAGEPQSILVINTDITEKKQMESQILRTQRMECIGALAGGIAHDLNNMLSPILIAVDLLRSAQNPENQAILDMVGTSAQRGADMVKQILSFARGVSGEQAITDLKHIIKDMVRLAQDTFSRSIRIERSVPSNLWRVKGNPTQLHQVLLNLCVNARDAMDAGGTLSILAENVELEGAISPWKHEPATGAFVKLCVKDTGDGIAPEVMPKLFDPFFTTKETGKGTGLGLSTVMGIVKHHGGFVDVRSELGKGAAFMVYLPASIDAQEVAAEIGDEPLHGAGEEILLIDDEIALVEMTRLMLEAHNYHVITATDGAAAVQLYRDHKERIQAVLTDMMMPIMDGPATIRELRKINPGVRIVCISGLGSSAYYSSTQGLRVEAYLKKPYIAADLLKTLRRVLTMSLS